MPLPLRESVCALLLLSIHSGAAANTSAGELLENCQHSDNAYQQYCRGYIVAIADSSDVCVPDDILPATLVNLVASSLTDSEDAATVQVQKRLGEVFPCTAEKASGDSPEKKKNWSNKQRFGK